MRAASRAFDYDASTWRDLDFTGRCLSSLGKAETGRSPASWFRCDDQRPSVGRHDLLDDGQAEPGPVPCGVAPEMMMPQRDGIPGTSLLNFEAWRALLRTICGRYNPLRAIQSRGYRAQRLY